MDKKIIVTYSFERELIGYWVTNDLFDMSIHKGLRAWGFTKQHAINNLHKKWNKLVNRDFISTKERYKNNPNIHVEQIHLKECEKI